MIKAHGFLQPTVFHAMPQNSDKCCRILQHHGIGTMLLNTAVNTTVY